MASPVSAPTAVYLLGIVGAVCFYGRFYVQWIASEIARRSVMPILFWYMSSVGSLMLLTFAILTQSPLGALGHNLNIVIYARNLVHIWREQGVLTKRRSYVVHVAVVVIVLVAVGFVARTWLHEYHVTRQSSPSEARQTWLWLAVGLVGQVLFASRFLIQWFVSEKRRKSVVPNVFWQISIVATILQGATFMQRREWIFGIGMASNLLIYVRNLWLIYRNPEQRETVTLSN